MLQTFTRTATGTWPWLASLLIATSLTYAIANAAPPATVAAEQCQTSADPMLTYAVTTQRVPADLVQRTC